MVKNLVKAVTLIIGLAPLTGVVAGGGGLLLPLPPVVWKTAVDLQENVLVISGRRFGTTMPTVRLANYVLRLQRFTENEIVASLPPDIQTATYSLTVTNSSRSTSDLFSVAYLPGSIGKTKMATKN